MDLNHLRSFIAVAELGHLTRAAEKVHLSQPALSSHIKTLEEQFGVALFERSSSGMALTPSGRQLLGEAKQIIAAVAQLTHSAQDLRGQPTGSLKIGTVLEPSVLRIGNLMRGMREKYPQLDFDLHQVMSSEAIARIRNGSLDAAFYFGVSPEADIHSIPLRDIVYRLALPAAWADKLVGASWEELTEQPWIVAPAPSSHRRLIVDLFGDGSPGPQRIVEADNESVILNLVESDVGISLIRDEIAVQSVEAGRSVIWPHLEVTTRLWFVHTSERADDPLLAAVVDVLCETWDDVCKGAAAKPPRNAADIMSAAVSSPPAEADAEPAWPRRVASARKR